MSNIVIISGSPTQPSRSYAIASYLNKLLSTQGHQIEQINVRDLPPEDLIYANFNSPAVNQALEKVKQAHALIVISPVYKASYTGVLKTFFDLIPEKGLAEKVILPIANGGSIAHLLSLEYSFKPLFSILGSQEILSGVYLLESQFSYKENELTFIESELEKRIQTAIENLLAKLKEIEPSL
ncbi:NADPH-dependent FMN reductase [Niallia oryzisoli]|uniref:NADPH-dependent FMN reductase n=1 Tax=Niallia oryzisoli TaxID=1737571 RepID=A0ABZ2CJX0_9BACI